MKKSSPENGVHLIHNLTKTLPDTPGVYRMLNKKGDALYVGKAKSLKKRVGSYTHIDQLPIRLQRMVSETYDMVFIHTHTETEALLLESNLIKKLKPRYNILLRDDKSFPYILLTKDHEFPLLVRHRGARKREGDYYGPFASSLAVNRTITALQKAFMLRNCTDHMFKQRTRPCLQYHIHRCTAPCVGLITPEHYKEHVMQAKQFLSGKNQKIQESLATDMQKASDAQDYESAAKLRDRIRALTSIQGQQDIHVPNLKDADIIGIYRQGAQSCIQVFFFRGGQNFGNRAYFPLHTEEEATEDILGAFIAQFYENKTAPPLLIISHNLKENMLWEEALHIRHPQQKVRIIVPQTGTRKRLMDFVLNNAWEAWERDHLKRQSEKMFLEKTAQLFKMEHPPKRIEIYDNSHISGTKMVGAMVVAGQEGFQKKAYRKFNIKNADKSDDYGMMREVITRRFKQIENRDDWPDLILIDGGKGQLSAVTDVLEALGIADDLQVVAIAKGVDRHAGREKFFMKNRDMFQLPEHDPVLHYLQRLRDEAHRFAIGVHRTRRLQDISTSPLDAIPGIGTKRKKALLRHFGTSKDIARAGIQALQQVPGISRDLASVIYNHFHES